jgi:hypothetical protein
LAYDPHVFKRGRSAETEQVSLPDARKALVERYMIDAEESEQRGLRLVEEHPVRTEALQLVGIDFEMEAAEPESDVAEPEAEPDVPEPEAEPDVPEPEAHAEPEPEPVVGAPAPEPPTAVAPEEPQPAPEELAAPEETAADDPPEPTDDLPVYVWLQRLQPDAPSDADWARELVRAREARTAAARERELSSLG